MPINAHHKLDSKEEHFPKGWQITPLNAVALASIFLAIIVTSLKFYAYYVTGSVALYSDALESTINIVTAIAAYWALHISAKPADLDHPFGHHKAEYFSAVLESALIIFAAVMIIKEVWDDWNHCTPLHALGKGLIFSLVSSLLNLFWAFVLFKKARASRSLAIKATATHLLSDVLSSFAVALAVLGALLTGWQKLDAVVALCVAIHILWQGWKIFNDSIQGLMDVGVSWEESAKIQNIISTNAVGAIEIHDFRTRQAGCIVFIEFHLVVASDMSVAEAHKICDRIEQAIQAQIETARVVIHIEPEEEAKLPPGSRAVPFA